MNSDWEAMLLILAMGLGTFGTRIAGHLVLSRFEPLNRRAEAALDAVPAAIITAIVAPLALTAGPAEAIAAGLTALAAMRLPILPVLAIGTVSVVALRTVGL